MSPENMPGHRTHAQEQSPSRSAPNFGHGGRATTVTAAVQPRCDTRARRRRPRHATPPRATHRHGTVTNLGGTTTRRHPRRTPAAAQPPPPPPPRGRLDSVRALPCPGKSDGFEPETPCTSKQVLYWAIQSWTDDDVYYYIRWRLKLGLNKSICTKGLGGIHPVLRGFAEAVRRRRIHARSVFSVFFTLIKVRGVLLVPFFLKRSRLHELEKVSKTMTG